MHRQGDYRRMIPEIPPTGEILRKSRVCAIHQPNFFPWLGYFDKIRRADVFVFLDDVAYPKSGHSMSSLTNRVRIEVQGVAQWIGCPLQRQAGVQPIREVCIDGGQPWRRKMLRTIEQNYRKHPGFDWAISVVEPLVSYPCGSLAEFNIHAVERIASALGLQVTFARQSALNVEGKATELLVSLTRAAGCDAYLCGGGAAGYQDDALFASSGLGLIYQNFTESPYGPLDRFIPGLSVIDYLMKTGEPSWPAAR